MRGLRGQRTGWPLSSSHTLRMRVLGWSKGPDTWHPGHTPLSLYPDLAAGQHEQKQGSHCHPAQTGAVSLFPNTSFPVFQPLQPDIAFHLRPDAALSSCSTVYYCTSHRFCPYFRVFYEPSCTITPSPCSSSSQRAALCEDSSPGLYLFPSPS